MRVAATRYVRAQHACVMEPELHFLDAQLRSVLVGDNNPESRYDPHSADAARHLFMRDNAGLEKTR